MKFLAPFRFLYDFFLAPCLGRLTPSGKKRPFNLGSIKIPKENYFLPQYPKISIVTPSYNQAPFLEQTLQSIIQQNYPNLEAIVIDGGSTDGSLEILRKNEKKLSYWISEKDRGQSHAINKGMKASSGEIMAYLNSDDVLINGSLYYAAHFFANHPEVDVIYSHRILIDGNNMEIGRWILPQHSNKVLFYRDYIPQETMFWRRRIWEKTGSTLDESFHYAMDWELIVRFIQAGAKMARVPAFFGAFRIHENQKTTTVSKDWVDEREKIHKKFFGRIPNKKETVSNIFGYLMRSRLLELLWKFNLIRFIHNAPNKHALFLIS